MGKILNNCQVFFQENDKYYSQVHLKDKLIFLNMSMNMNMIHMLFVKIL